MDQDLIVDWQNNFHQIKERGQYLLETGKWSDCRFLVGGGAPSNQKIIDGHKLILAIASPVFERMFYGNLPDKTDPIIIPDVQPDAFQSMLEYIYTDKITISSFDKACELCYVAKKYLLPNVVEQCTHFLWADLSPKNACRAYEFAKLFDEPRLMQSSMEIIASKTKEVLIDPSFLEIEISTLLAILDQDKLNIDSELDLFNGILKYANERELFPTVDSKVEQKESIEPTVDVESMIDGNEAIDEVKIIDEPVVELNQDDGSRHYVAEIVESQCSNPVASVSMNSLIDAQRRILDVNLIKQAVKKIRFLTLTPQQFAEGPARSKLLEQNEALSILIKISSPSINDCPMPEGFCTSRSTRKYFTSRCDNDMSSYRQSFDGKLDCNQLTTTHPSTSYGNVNSQFSDSDFTNDTRRLYCVRTLQQQFDYRNTSVTDCGLTFQVDTNIWIIGVQVPTQVLCGELMNSAGFSERYSEILYAHLQDMQGSRLTYTHCTSRVRYDSLMEISFDRPVYIYRNQIYKIFVVFNKVGWYPMYTCVPDIICNRVKFMFNVGGSSGESVRDGLIRAIIFTTPHCPEHA